MSKSFKDNPEFIDEELESLRKKGLEPKIVEREDYPNRVVFECDIPNGTLGNDTGKNIELEIIFPDNFPFFRPQVLAKNIHLPRHQHPFHMDLCLLPKETINWDIQDIGSFLEDRLPKVLKEGRETDPEVIASTPDEQAEPVSEYYAGTKTLVFTSGRPKIMEEEVDLIAKELKILDSGVIKVGIKQNPSSISLEEVTGGGLIININKWIDKNGELIESDFESFFDPYIIRTLSWYKLSKFPSEIYGENFLKEFKKIVTRDNATGLQSLNLRTKNFNLLSSFCLLFPEEQAPGKYGWGWAQYTYGEVFSIGSKKKKAPKPYSNLFSKIHYLSNTEYFNRIPQVKNFQGKTVGLLGVGAIGAPIAIELAKNGIKTLKILDYDWFESPNTVRWPLGMDYLGYSKIEALKKFISKNYPYTNVIPFYHKIGDPYLKIDENELLKELFNECDVIIDATVENAVNHLISKRCQSLNIPYILAEGRRGGWGGLVARFLPNITEGCWTCLQNKLYNDSENNSIKRPPDDNSGNIQQAGCGDISFTGTHFDLINVSLAVVKIVANIFSEEDNFSWDVGILSTVKDEDNKDILPQWETYPLTVSKYCAYQHDSHS